MSERAWTPAEHDVLWMNPPCCAFPDLAQWDWGDEPERCESCIDAQGPVKYLLATPQREAAPDLYEAANEVIKHLPTHGGTQDEYMAYEALANALARAEGRS